MLYKRNKKGEKGIKGRGFEGLLGARNSTRKVKADVGGIVVEEWQAAWGTRLEKISLVP